MFAPGDSTISIYHLKNIYFGETPKKETYAIKTIGKVCFIIYQ